jgi:hypothetical protein
MTEAKIELNAKALEQLVYMGCTDAEIAAVFGISQRTLIRRKKEPIYAEIYKNGRNRSNASLRQKLFKKAEEGSMAAISLLCKTQLGMVPPRASDPVLPPASASPEVSHPNVELIVVMPHGHDNKV